MDKTVRKFSSLDEMEAGEYRYWQSRPAHERMQAVSELTQAAYALKGAAPDVPRLRRTLAVFNAHRVKYLIVGGYAVSFHAQPRATKDIDVLISPDAENAKVVFGALAIFGAPLTGLTSDDFAGLGSFFRMGHEPVAVNIVSEIPGVNFDTAWARRVEAVIDTATGLRAHFISRDDLISAKVAAGRPQDLADVSALQKAELS